MLRRVLQRTANMQQLALDLLHGTHGLLETIAGTGQSVELSQLKPMRKFVHTLRHHHDAVLAFTGTRVFTVIVGGFNHTVKNLKNRASCFRHFDARFDTAYLSVGDLERPDQIPARFPTS